MTPFYQSPGVIIKYDIIAVTGLSAHAFGSWKSPDQAGVMWLRDFLKLDLADFRVLTWGYRSSIRNDQSMTSIAAVSRDFLQDIRFTRGKSASDRPLILIGHSLGGLVLQQVIFTYSSRALADTDKETDEDNSALLRSCIGILFFGVPNQGLNPTSIQSLVKGDRNARFLQDLSPDSEFLFSLRRDFRNCHKSMKDCIIVSFYESKGTNSVKRTQDGEMKRCGDPIRMVSRDSAICFQSENCNQIAIQKDHSKMVKYRSESDENYQRVVDNEIRQIMAWISPLEPHKRHQDIRQKRLEGTRNWFLLEPEFQKWRDSEPDDDSIGSILACSGIPGAGKSVICRQSLIRIFFTARPHINWKELLKRNPGLSLDHIRLDAQPDDIRRYVSHAIEMDENSDCMNDKLRSEILERIVDNSERMFLLPALQIQTVLDQTIIRKRRDAFSNMPITLETAFVDTISRMKNQKSAGKSKQAIDVLKWTFLAKRPLTVIELRHALSIAIDPSKMQPRKLPLAYDETLDWDNFSSEKSLTLWKRKSLG
ncbi:hypothetical protein FPQ18DRAFT_305547 [Pyronema domesticum]|nr:hypothetical protein FPQ18DRAFT_305547 [Pyronema domesticum]